MEARRPAGVVAARHQLEGAGFGVFRPFPSASLEMLDPFLLLDEMEPVVHRPGSAVGAPDHPHRGFETVTYVLDGEVEHRDSMGNTGLIGPGEVQWMTAGAGIVHSEMPSTRLQTEGGRVHGFQLWVNLPAELKRSTPRYQGLAADELPTVAGDGWRAVVIAGSILGADGPATTHTEIAYAHVELDPGVELGIESPADHNAGAYVFAGHALAGPENQPVPTRHLAVWAAGRGPLTLATPPDVDEPAEILVMTGRPIAEPVARYGPFVMNTRDELIEAIEDFQAGRMGTIAPVGAV